MKIKEIMWKKSFAKISLLVSSNISNWVNKKFPRIFDKGNEKIGDIVNITISDARGVTLFGYNNKQELKNEVA